MPERLAPSIPRFTKKALARNVLTAFMGIPGWDGPIGYIVRGHFITVKRLHAAYLGSGY